MEFRTSRRPRSGPRLALLALTLLVLPAAAWSQGVTVAIVPAEQSVAPGAELDVEIQVTQAGAPFNGFDAVVSYDPAALEFMPASPTTNQQGCLMTGACSAACGSTFHRFTASSTTLSSTDILPNRARFWNVRLMPMSTMRCGGRSRMLRPSNRMSPAAGV